MALHQRPIALLRLHAPAAPQIQASVDDFVRFVGAEGQTFVSAALRMTGPPVTERYRLCARQHELILIKVVKITKAEVDRDATAMNDVPILQLLVLIEPQHARLAAVLDDA